MEATMADLTEKEIQEHEAEVDNLTGRVSENFDIFAGTDPGDAQQRRLERLEYRESDMGPEPIAAIDHPWASKSAADVQTYDDLHSFLDCQDTAGRERHEDWDLILNTYIKPRLPEISKEQLQQLLLEDGFGERCYQVGKKLQREYRSKAPTMEEVDSLSPEQFTERLAEWTRTARARGDRDNEADAFVTKSELRQLTQLGVEDFARALDIIKSR
jgi:hypothetical protein